LSGTLVSGLSSAEARVTMDKDASLEHAGHRLGDAIGADADRLVTAGDEPD
jgi:hypothetical protein